MRLSDLVVHLPKQVNGAKKTFLDDRTKGTSQNPQDDPKNNDPTRWMLGVFLYLLDKTVGCALRNSFWSPSTPAFAKGLR